MTQNAAPCASPCLTALEDTMNSPLGKGASLVNGSCHTEIQVPVPLCTDALGTGLSREQRKSAESWRANLSFGRIPDGSQELPDFYLCTAFCSPSPRSFRVSLPVCPRGVKACCICKEARHDAPQDRVWITYKRQQQRLVRVSTPAPCSTC